MELDIDQWEIFMLGGAFVIGLPSADKTKLSPCYQLIRAPSPEGINQAVVPLSFFAEWAGIPYPTDAPKLAIKDIGRHEKAGLRAGVQKCLEVVGKMKAANSGIIAPPAGFDIRGK